MFHHMRRPGREGAEVMRGGGERITERKGGEEIGRWRGEAGERKSLEEGEGKDTGLMRKRRRTRRWRRTS